MPRRRHRPDTIEARGVRGQPNRPRRFRSRLRDAHRPERLIGKFLRDERAGADSRFEVTLREELIVRRGYRDPRHAVRIRERARGRHALAAPEAPAENAAAPPVVDLPMERRGGRAIDDEGDRHKWTGPL